MELLIMEIDHAYVGVPTSDVKEVLRAARLSPAPGTNANIMGLLNLRETVVPVIAMRTLLGLRNREIVSTDHFIVLQTQSQMFALHVDRAIDILTVSAAACDEVNSSVALAVPDKFSGIVHIQRGESLWARVGPFSSVAAQGVDQRESTSLP